MDKKESLAELATVPGIGPSIAENLWRIGIRRVADLRNKDPEKLYEFSNKKAGIRQDPCLLYTFRCAVYFASTKKPDPRKLKWWYWKDGR